MDHSEIKIVGESEAIQKNTLFLQKIAISDKNVLILGETGVGKGLAAKVLHELSPIRKDRPFIALNCANIPKELFEAELFGYGKGAFTGADNKKPGLFEAAEKGSIFLDEVGDLPLHLQAKVLRVIENREFRRIGENQSRKVLARFIFATNKDLEEEVKKGNFRKDLYYRINVMRLWMPPLRERKEDIPLLAQYILKKEKEFKFPPKRISFKALMKLKSYDFPGNVRELENILERACVYCEGDVITEKDVRIESEVLSRKANQKISPEHIRKVLEKCRWNKTKAAEEMGKSRRQFYRYLEKYHMWDVLRPG